MSLSTAAANLHRAPPARAPPLKVARVPPRVYETHSTALRPSALRNSPPKRSHLDRSVPEAFGQGRSDSLKENAWPSGSSERAERPPQRTAPPPPLPPKLQSARQMPAFGGEKHSGLSDTAQEAHEWKGGPDAPKEETVDSSPEQAAPEKPAEARSLGPEGKKLTWSKRDPPAARPGSREATKRDRMAKRKTLPIHEENVRVIVRLRPLAVGRDLPEVVRVHRDRKTLEVVQSEHSLEKRVFRYDRVFPQHATQEDIFNYSRKVVKELYKGYNVTLLAYGQTGSGKTFTMGTGKSVVPVLLEAPNVGLIPRCLTEIFKKLPRARLEAKVTFMEIYGTEIRDLLSNASSDKGTKSRLGLTRAFLPLGRKQKSQITVNQLPDGSCGVRGLAEREVSCASEALSALEDGSARRSVGRTCMNEASSRSHAVFQLHVKFMRPCVNGFPKKGEEGEEDGPAFLVQGPEIFYEEVRATLTFVDLAGSEREQRTKATGTTKIEGVDINLGLEALGNVIKSLANRGERRSKGQQHIPYRSHILTRVLSNCLGGNSKALFIACASADFGNFNETICTLKYATRVQNVRNNVKRNTYKVDLQASASSNPPPLPKKYSSSMSAIDAAPILEELARDSEELDVREELKPVKEQEEQPQEEEEKKEESESDPERELGARKGSGSGQQDLRLKSTSSTIAEEESEDGEKPAGCAGAEAADPRTPDQTKPSNDHDAEDREVHEDDQDYKVASDDEIDEDDARHAARFTSPPVKAQVEKPVATQERVGLYEVAVKISNLEDLVERLSDDLFAERDRNAKLTEKLQAAEARLREYEYRDSVLESNAAGTGRTSSNLSSPCQAGNLEASAADSPEGRHAKAPAVMHEEQPIITILEPRATPKEAFSTPKKHEQEQIGSSRGKSGEKPLRGTPNIEDFRRNAKPLGASVAPGPICRLPEPIFERSTRSLYSEAASLEDSGRGFALHIPRQWDGIPPLEPAAEEASGEVKASEPEFFELHRKSRSAEI